MLVDLTLESRLKHQHLPREIQTAMPDEEMDHSLVRRMAAGDDSALRELYAAHGQRLYAYALRLTGDPAQADDVLQETLVAVWKSAGKFRGEGRLIAWLLGIVHHTALKSLRYRTQPLTDEIEESLPAGHPSPEQQIERTELGDQVRLGLNALSTEHRSALELIFYQELSLEEAARVCGVPLGTIKSRLSYARQHLRGILSRQGMENTR